ncbi:glycoprotease family-domain-containing protein [Hypoxylon crocopeplum]|nr:glycoprotease family-domain-containing protein [Hypoxylon crocopeplum]
MRRATWLTTLRPCSRARAHHSYCMLAFRNSSLLANLFHRSAPSSSLSLPLQQQQQCLLSTSSRPQRRQHLLTLAIETSCDDTCVAVLEKDAGAGGAARLRFNKKITSDNRQFRGVHPMTAVASHTKHLAAMVREAMRALPEAPEIQTVEIGEASDEGGGVSGKDVIWVDGRAHRKPDFITVTRGPGMVSNLSTGLNTAKGLAVAWDVPLLGVNHMQAHALTPRLVTSLRSGDDQQRQQNVIVTGEGNSKPAPTFPFLSLLVSGGHSLLVLSRSLNDHAILAEAQNIAIGDMLDKCAREIVPPSEVAAGDNVMYGPLLERFAFPDSPNGINYDYDPPSTRADEIKIYDSGYGWTLTPPLFGTTKMAYEFAGLNGQVLKILLEHSDMAVPERRLLARHAMRLAFEHLASRLLLALSKNSGENGLLRDIRTVVVAGGVASNRYLMHILRAVLDVRGYGHIELVCPPLHLCTDNAAMIAWTGMEMYEAGWRSELDILAIRKWPLDPDSEGGGILGAPGWTKVEGES